jgi:hypothetical protein
VPDELYQLTKEQFAALLQLIGLMGPSGELRKANTRYRDMLQKHADLMEQSEAIISRLDAFEGTLREFIEESGKQFSDIERLMLLEKTGNEESREASRVKGRMQKRQDDEQLRQLLKETYQSLGEVLIQIARHGGDIDAPVKLIRQREELEAAVERIKDELGILD